MPTRSRLQTHLVIRLIAVCIIISAAFLFVVSFIVRSQNLRISHEFIVRAFTVILDDIGATRDKLLKDTLQFAEQKQIGSAVNLVRDYKNEASSTLYFTQDSYRRLAASVAGMGRTTGIMRMMVYDRDGDLAAFVRNDPKESRHGYAFGYPRPAFMINSNQGDKETSGSPWTRNEECPGIAVRLESALPTLPITAFEVIDEVLCLVCYVPLYFSSYNQQSEQIVREQVGVAVTIQALGASLEKRLSALTGTAVGMLPDYKNGTSSKIAPAVAWQEAPLSTPPSSQTLEATRILFDEVVVDGADYFQGVFPLFEGKGQNAAISVRYSTAFASNNTRQMLTYMLFVSVCCVILIIPLALFFSNRLVRPVTALAKTAQAIQQGALDQRADIHKDDEVGDLARAFNAMTDQLRASLNNLTQEKDALRKYERIVSSSQDLMALIDRDLRLEAVNESFTNTFSRNCNVVVGHNVGEVFGEPFFHETFNPRLQRAFAGESLRFQEQIELAGHQRLMEFAIFPFIDEEGLVQGVVLNGRDVTETRKLEEQLKHSQKIESIGTLAGGVAHEINNPINGIMNYAQLILDQSPPQAATLPYAEEIIHETKRIAQIVRNLLTFARNEKQSHSPAHFEDIATAVLSLIQTVMRRDQITLLVDIAPGLPKIKCRSQQIQQVLMNLITNARDAINERYPDYHPEKQIWLSASLIDKGGKSYVRATVEDHGVGIPSEILKKIFDPFFTTKPKETGTGLGLSISYGIVRDHGGDLQVESEPGHFTRFYLDLPVNNGWTLPARKGDLHE